MFVTRGVLVCGSKLFFDPTIFLLEWQGHLRYPSLVCYPLLYIHIKMLSTEYPLEKERNLRYRGKKKYADACLNLSWSNHHLSEINQIPWPSWSSLYSIRPSSAASAAWPKNQPLQRLEWMPNMKWIRGSFPYLFNGLVFIFFFPCHPPSVLGIVLWLPIFFPLQPIVSWK